MIFRLFENTYDADTIDAATTTPWIDVGGLGGDSISFTNVATSSSTPNTATWVIQGANDTAATKSDAVNVGSAVSVSGNGITSASADRPVFRYYRVSYAITSGSYVSTLRVLVKGDRS